MPVKSRRLWPVLAGALLALLAAGGFAASSALAGAPATVTVRVLGPAPNYEVLTPITQVTTTTAPVVKEGDSCVGTNAIGALNLATQGNWGGKFEGDEWLLTTIDGRIFEGPEYWGFWVNYRYATKGVCGQELEPGTQLLLYPENLPPGCYEEPKGPCVAPRLLSIEAPATAEVGKPVTVTVLAYPNPGGEPTSAPPSPAAGVTLQGGGSTVETNFEGHATLVFPGDETYTLRATGATGEEPRAVPGEALICAHEGNDGTCGTTAPTSGPAPAPSSSAPVVVPYTGPYALVANLTGIRDSYVYPRGKGPRVLSGTVSSHASVTSISLRLRRTYRGRCWAYSGSRARLQRVRCRKGSFFQIASGGDSFSYLLPSRLPAGRYVLDIEATDSAGNHAPLDRGSSRIVFYVK